MDTVYIYRHSDGRVGLSKESMHEARTGLDPNAPSERSLFASSGVWDVWTYTTPKPPTPAYGVMCPYTWVEDLLADAYDLDDGGSAFLDWITANEDPTVIVTCLKVLEQGETMFNGGGGAASYGVRLVREK